MQRLDFLDSLRGLAAIYIVLYHMVFIPQPTIVIVPQWAAAFVHTGGTAVTLFFVASAFSLCLTWHLHDREVHQIKNFFVRRFFRIAPLFYFWIGLSLLRDVLIFDALHSPFEIFSSLLFFFNLVPGGQDGFVWASWIISVEILFYLFFPMIIKHISDTWQAAALFVGTLLLSLAFKSVLDYLPLNNAIRLPFYDRAFLHHLPVFAFGMLVYFLFKRFRTKAVPQSVGYTLMGAATNGYAAALKGYLNILFFDAYYWQAVIYGAFFLGLAISPITLIVNRVTKFLGKISYSLYLNHPTIVYLLIPVYRIIYEWPIPTTFKYLCAVSMTLSILVVASYLTYRFIEKPGIRLGKRFIRKSLATVGD
jgi:peptidoglycan/LPS O-acetylase OafA/YrhL